MRTKLFAVALLMCSTAAFAQFANSSSSTSSDGWNTIYLQWNPSTLKPDKGSSVSFTGFSIGYNKAVKISQSIPLFVETGLGVQYSFKTRDMADEFDLDEEDLEYVDPEEKFTMLSAKIPISLAYEFQIPNSKIAIIPNVGVDFRFNILGKSKFDWNLSGIAKGRLKDYYGDDWDDYELYGTPVKGTDKNLFDKDDMGSGNTWKRVQIGWHAGVNARICEKFLVGFSYGTDFTEIAKKIHIHTASITLGYYF